MAFIGAGLPSLPAQLADATSYAERLYEYRPVGLLDESAARNALVIPARDRGVEWQADGLGEALATAQGYPYFLQAIGKHVWDNARRSSIGADDISIGLAEAQREVDDGLYRSRWERATPAQRELLRALAGIGTDGPASVADIAAQMGKVRTSDISVSRNELIKKGLVYAPERGLLAFTAPGMHQFVMRQTQQPRAQSNAGACPSLRVGATDPIAFRNLKTAGQQGAGPSTNEPAAFRS